MNQQIQEKFNLLSTEQKIQKGLDITRSLIAYSNTNTIEQKEEEAIIIPDDLQSFTLLSIEVSPFPTESRKIMKYIETQQLIKFLDKAAFVEVDDYCIAFANVADLSYHNFENILNLDHLFNNVSFKQYSLKKKKGLQIFEIIGSTDTLLSLDKLNYYNLPLNGSQRGGKRLIFHSNQLSYSLTEMIKESTFFDRKNFSHVNNVFRLNNFAPGDRQFKSHYDTPFADKNNSLYSRYTMLIYLTDFAISKIEANHCIIFDQKYKHEGNPYPNKNKIFIRTELIYEDLHFEFDEKIAMMFNRACYMTKELEQQQYSADLFNNCVQMRYKLKESEKVPRVYLMKRNLNISYITDGNFYWFKNNIDLQSIALLIILDYFNAKIYGISNIQIHSKVIPRNYNSLSQEEEESDQSIFSLLECVSFTSEQPDKDKVNLYSDLSDYIPESLCNDFTTFICHCEFRKEERTSKSIFNRSRDLKIDELDNILSGNTILIFDQIIKMNPKNFKIQMDNVEEDDNLASGKIRLSDFFINPENKINFAGCECSAEFEDDDVLFHYKQKINTFYLPDISFQQFENGIKLSIDMFNNGYVHKASSTFLQPYTYQEKTIITVKRKLRKDKKSSNSDSDLNNDDENEEEENDNEDEEEEEDQDEDEDENYLDPKISVDVKDIKKVKNKNNQQQLKNDLLDIGLRKSNNEDQQSMQEEQQEKRKFSQENIQQFIKTKKTTD